MRTWRTAVTAAICACLCDTAHAQAVPTANDLVYATFGSGPTQQSLTLDVYIPTTGSGPFPVVVRIHGGGWSGGTNEPIPTIYVQMLNQGIAIVSPRYRLTSQAGMFNPAGASIVFPAQIHDIKAVVRWIRANAATYNFDSNRVGSCGESAGGHLSALLGTSAGVPAAEGTVGGNLAFSSRVQAVGDYFGPSDILNMAPDVTTPPGTGFDHDAPASPESHLLGWDDPGQGVGNIRANIGNPTPPYPALVALARLASPVFHVSPDDPPFIIAHGGADTTVAFNQSVRLDTALDAVGVLSDFHPNPTAGHGPQGIPTDQAVVAFFVQRLITSLPAPPCPGDANRDRSVNAADLSVLLGNFGSPTPSGENGDLNSDALVNSADLSVLLGQFGLGC